MATRSGRSDADGDRYLTTTAEANIREEERVIRKRKVERTRRAVDRCIRCTAADWIVAWLPRGGPFPDVARHIKRAIDGAAVGVTVV